VAPTPEPLVSHPGEAAPRETQGASDRREAIATIGVAGWTAVSRATGLLRVVAVGAALGPTFFANVFSATNTVPNMTYNLMAGSLLVTLVVPPLVEALDRQGPDAARRLGGGLLGVVIAGFCAAGLLVVGLGPLLVHLVTLGVPDGGGVGSARGQAWALLLLVVPQVVLYGVAAVAVAAQNARSRYALAAAAPAVENVGLVVTLVLAARWFGTGLEGSDVPTREVLLLGVGSTLSVSAHAGLQLFGAARAGLSLRPRWGWRDPEVRAVVARIVPSIGTAMLEATWYFAVIVAAGTIPGGVVAAQMGLNFYNLPLALSSRPIGTVALPRLSLDVVRGRLNEFRRTYTRSLSRSWFVTVPAAVGLVALAGPVADVLAFGALDRSDGVRLVALAVGTMALALPAAAAYEVARQAVFARLDARSPLLVGAAQVAVVLVGVVVVTLTVDGPGTMVGLGVAVVAGDLLRAVLMHRAALRGIDDRGTPEWRVLARHLTIAVAVIVPSALLGRVVVDAVAGRPGALAGVVLTSILAAVGYLAAQSWLRAPELVGVLPVRRAAEVAA
jgi:putative peptidoglycan lipid II flippase